MKNDLPASCRTWSASSETERTVRHDLIALAHQPWVARVGRHTVLVRRSQPRDLHAVARMHARCSARSLLDRFRCGGRAPSMIALDRQLREPLSYLAVLPDGSVIATATLWRDENHAATSAEVGLLVEDGWQRRGLGSDLMAHLAGVAQVGGYTDLITYPATAVSAAQRLMVEVGRTRVVPHFGDMHLHTHLSEGAALGLGSVRERLAG
jgi:GNAT superfamily N-acetyltransferase